MQARATSQLQKKRERPFVSPRASAGDEEKSGVGVKTITSGYIKAQKLRNLMIRKSKIGNLSKLRKDPVSDLDALSFIPQEETPKN